MAEYKSRTIRFYLQIKLMEKVYKTGLMDDPGLTERLYESGADFCK